MTHTQQAEQEGLDLGRGTERVERILHGLSAPIDNGMDYIAAQPPVITNGTFAAEDAAEQAQNARQTTQTERDNWIAETNAKFDEQFPVHLKPPAAPPARRKPVKGKCMCGKYYSAHHLADGRAFCTKDATHVGGGTFTLAPDAPPPAPVEAPQATAGGMLTEAQAQELWRLLNGRDAAKAAQDKASQAHIDADDRLECAEVALQSFIDSLTVRP